MLTARTSEKDKLNEEMTGLRVQFEDLITRTDEDAADRERNGGNRRSDEDEDVSARSLAVLVPLTEPI